MAEKYLSMVPKLLELSSWISRRILTAYPIVVLQWRRMTVVTFQIISSSTSLFVQLFVRVYIKIRAYINEFIKPPRYWRRMFLINKRYVF